MESLTGGGKETPAETVEGAGCDTAASDCCAELSHESIDPLRLEFVKSDAQQVFLGEWVKVVHQIAAKHRLPKKLIAIIVHEIAIECGGVGVAHEAGLNMKQHMNAVDELTKKFTESIKKLGRRQSVREGASTDTAGNAELHERASCVKALLNEKCPEFVTCVDLLGKAAQEIADKVAQQHDIGRLAAFILLTECLMRLALSRKCVSSGIEDSQLVSKITNRVVEFTDVSVREGASTGPESLSGQPGTSCL